MTISESIAKYRKDKGFTQEQLGELLGVTNQAVSKWESAVSMPDIMLLPKIAEVFGITLEELYGIEKTQTEERIKADDYPKVANKQLIDHFQKHSKTQFHTENLEGRWSLICISDKEGGIYVSNSFSIFNSDFKQSGSEAIFEMNELSSAMKKLSDNSVRKALTYMYRESFLDGETSNKSFFIKDIAKACNLSEDETFEAMEKLNALNMIEPIVKNHVTEYCFLKSRAFWALAVFRSTELLLGGFAYEVLRDTSIINDYAFEKLW